LAHPVTVKMSNLLIILQKEIALLIRLNNGYKWNTTVDGKPDKD